MLTWIAPFLIFRMIMESGGTVKNFTGNTTFHFTRTSGSSNNNNQQHFFGLYYTCITPNVTSSGSTLDFRNYSSIVMGNILLNGDLNIRSF